MNRARLLYELKRDEGLRLVPYLDTEQVWTVGFGHTGPDVVPGEPWSLSRASHALDNDVEATLTGLARISWWRALDPARQGAIANMAYNLGIPRLLGFRRMIAALTIGDHETAAREALDSKWHRQVGARAERIAGVLRTGIDAPTSRPF